MAAAALPAAASAGPGAGPKVPVLRGIHGLTAGPVAPQAPVLPFAGDTPAVAATGIPQVPIVFDYTGSDKHGYEAPLASPTQAESLGGTLIGGPGDAFVPPPLGPGVITLARGGDNAMYELAFTSGGSPTWVRIGGGLTSRPGVAAGALSVPGGEAIDAVVRGTNGAVWDLEANATSQRPWRSLGGATLAGSGPAAVNVGGTLYVLAIRTDGSVWVNRSTDGAHWSGWRPLGGRASGDVGVATPKPGVGVVFVRGPDNALWYKEFAGTTPGVTSGWHSLGGQLTSGAGAGSAANGNTSVLVLGPDGHIWKRSGTWPNFSPWVRLF